VENCYSDVLDLHPNGQKTRFLFARFFWLVEEIENWNVIKVDKVIRPFCQALHCDYELSLGRHAIHRNHGAVARAGDYLRADVPFEGKNDNFDPVFSSKVRYGVQLNVEKVFMLTARLKLEIMATDPPPKKSPGTYPIPLLSGGLFCIFIKPVKGFDCFCFWRLFFCFWERLQWHLEKKKKKKKEKRRPLLYTNLQRFRTLSLIF
jgi:hypothetical protein